MFTYFVNKMQDLYILKIKCHVRKLIQSNLHKLSHNANRVGDFSLEVDF